MSHEHGVTTNGASAIGDGDAPDPTDFANYFCTYGYLYHQKEMLEDHKRTGAYYQAIMSNRRQFAGKVVLDVGTGSGILAMFAAKAGASKVYAVEATTMAVAARRLIEHNKLDSVIHVIQGTIESIDLPEKVDIIISEWMGYFLLRESMLDSVLIARDKFLKPGGAMYPSHATMMMAPQQTPNASRRLAEFQASTDEWADFVDAMRSFYQVDLSSLGKQFEDEQRDYFLCTSQWTDTHPQQLLGPPAVFKSYDLHDLTLEDLKAPMQESFTMYCTDGGPIEALCGWFDVVFKGSDANPADVAVPLSTAPDPTGSTHWGQQTFYLHPSIDCAPNDQLGCAINVSRRKDNQRLLKVKMDVEVKDGEGKHKEGSKTLRMQWNID